MSAIPTHVALIMDGNGRWATTRGLQRTEGHRRGAMSLKRVLRTAEKIGIRYVTLYAFSTENFSRPEPEVNFLMNLFEKFARKYGRNFTKNEVRFRAIGDLSKLPNSLQIVIKQLIKDTESFHKFNLTIALNYGARNEIVLAVKNLCGDIFSGDGTSLQHINWDFLRRYLYTADLPDPDLIIRTSGEQRLSNFLLLQAAYAELYFAKTFWPDFGEKEFLLAIEDYQHRRRRIGNIDEKTNI
ncbi:MAG: di-trans,poly-cis-decaprenylcistransferase [Puniceicoccales bacterium]|jgi:undecaprenyl diphosphate synthase|nr:di-trans,poly-cis-decaprenylcistransferase [Puniceicoccales bacterium]